MLDVIGLSSEGEGFGGWCSRRKDSAGGAGMVQDGPRWSKMVQESKMLKVFGGLVPHLFSKA